MDKKLLFSILLIAILISAALAYVMLTPKKSEDPIVNSSDTTQQDRPARESSDTSEANLKPGVYQEYSEDAVSATSGTKLLFFHAPWCPQCREIEKSINQDGIPAGVTVFKVDYDSNQSLRKKYGVTLQTTFVKIDERGDKLKSYVAYDEPKFSSVERELLQ